MSEGGRGRERISEEWMGRQKEYRKLESTEI